MNRILHSKAILYKEPDFSPHRNQHQLRSRLSCYFGLLGSAMSRNLALLHQTLSLYQLRHLSYSHRCHKAMAIGETDRVMEVNKAQWQSTRPWWSSLI